MEDIIEKTIPGLKIKIDRDTCIGTANCIAVAPGFFELDEDRICSFKNLKEETDKEIITEACSVCPVNALYVFDNKGKQIVP